MHYFLNIGSNLGNRKLNISRALRALEEKYGYFEVSEIIESKPWGYDSANDFMNIAVMIISDKTPHQVLDDIHEIENRLNAHPHRDEEGNYLDRAVDIDIMAADDMIIDDPLLTLPHRHLPERAFFLKPFSGLAPLWRHPVSGLTCDEMLTRLPNEE